MYLARLKIKGKRHYVIRESLPYSDYYIHRDLLDLGADPTLFIHYPGGNGYYYDACIEDTLIEKGVKFNPDDLDRLFFRFLDPEIQRVITGFDRGYQTQSTPPPYIASNDLPPIHIFDRRRFHYLRFGHSRQRHIYNVPEKIFRPLHGKSRDELEHYFMSEEHRLERRELGAYLFTIFQLNDAAAENSACHHHDPLHQIDARFVDRLCRLNSDRRYLAGAPKPHGLYEHLIKYVVFYFDFNILQNHSSWQYINDFRNRHRIYRPPPKTMEEIKDAEKLFGYGWKKLKRMDRITLTRIYRQLALKHHPDQGGNANAFRRLSKYYKALMEKKPREK